MSRMPDPNAPITVTVGIPSRIPTQDPNRAGKFDVIYPVEYGPFNRLTITLPEESATREAAETAAREAVTKLKKIGGFTFQV